jgi:leader peptidase (prepilin peptidase) / N-methyltransferase
MNILLASFESVTGLPEFVGYIFIFLLGAIIGSFLNVIIHRVPNEESVVFPNSACPKCKNSIKPYDNIPILSWLILGGKCRNCKNAISARYPAVELLTAMLFVLVFAVTPFNPFLPVVLVFVAAIVALVFIDAEHMILPDVINFPLLAFALLARIVFAFAFGKAYFPDLQYFPLNQMENLPAWLVSLIGAILGGLVGGGFLWLVGAIWKKLRGVDAMGFGDVKMMFAVGAILGWRLTFLSIFLGAFSGAIIGVVVISRQKEKDLQTQIPFGIFLGIGSILALLFGEQMIRWYFNTFVP